MKGLRSYIGLPVSLVLLAVMLLLNGLLAGTLYVPMRESTARAAVDLCEQLIREAGRAASTSKGERRWLVPIRGVLGRWASRPGVASLWLASCQENRLFYHSDPARREEIGKEFGDRHYRRALEVGRRGGWRKDSDKKAQWVTSGGRPAEVTVVGTITLFPGQPPQAYLGLTFRNVEARRDFLTWVSVSAGASLILYLLAVFLVAGVTIQRLGVPLLKLTETAEAVAGGDTGVRVPRSGRRPFARIERAFNGMLDTLTAASSSGDANTARAAAAREISRTRAAFPERVQGLSLAAGRVAAGDEEQDLTAVFPLSGSRSGILLVDNIGGNPCDLLRALDLVRPLVPLFDNAAKLLVWWNHAVRTHLPGRELSAFYGVYDAGTARLNFSAARGEPVAILRRSSGSCEQYALRGSLLGTQDFDAFRTGLQFGEVLLRAGDTVAVHSDGLGKLGTTGATRTPYERVSAALGAAGKRPVSEVKDRFFAELGERDFSSLELLGPEKLEEMRIKNDISLVLFRAG